MDFIILRGNKKIGQSKTRLSASPPSKERLNPCLDERVSKISRSCIVISLPSQESSKPCVETLAIINLNCDFNKSFMYSFWFTFHSGEIIFRFNFLQTFSN